MSGKALRRLLLLAAALIIWGPPALRLAGRELDAALANPFALDGAAFLQVGAWIFADALVLLVVLTHLARGTRLASDLLSSRPVRWYGLYGLLGIVSMTYSSSPVYTVFFAHKILLGILLLALLEWHWPARHGSRAIQVLLAVSSLQAVAIGVLYFVDRRWVTPFAAGGTGERVRVTGGVFADYGSSAVFAGLLCLTVLVLHSKPAYRALAGVGYLASWWLVVLSQTRASMAAGVAFLIIMMHAHPRARVQGALLAAGGGLVLVGLLPSVLRDIVSVGTREGDGLETLSGRTVAFSYLIERWQDAPVLGYGFAAGTRDALIDFVARRGLNIGAGHDALSTVLVDLGLLGLALLLPAYVSAWLAFARLYHASTDWRASVSAHQIACLLVWVTIQTVVSRSLASPHIVFIVAIVALWALQRRVPRISARSSLQQAPSREP